MRKNDWKKRIVATFLTITMAAACLDSGCGQEEGTETKEKEEKQTPDGIYLYGEAHSNECIQKQELKIWNDFYEEGMRDLFYEIPYYDAEILNIWMREENDEILDMLWENWSGTSGGEIESYNFFKSLKKECPGTVFHGTDIGHDYRTSGQWYLDYLEERGQRDSGKYRKTQKNIEQGEYYYGHSSDAIYRENKMVENFIEEYENLNGASIMGIYGGAHTDIDAMDYMTGTVPCMANQLYEKYGDRLHTKDLSGKEPIATEKIEVDGKKYQASYFGRFDGSTVSDGYESADYWRLEDSYTDFKGATVGEEVWNQNGFPMKLKSKQVYMVELTKEDGTVEPKYFRTDPNSFKKIGAVKEIVLN